MTTECRFRRAPSALARTVGLEVLVATPGDAHIRSLGGTAGVVWELMSEPRSVGELSVLAADIYGMPPATIEEDVRHLLSALEEDGLAERVG